MQNAAAKDNGRQHFFLIYSIFLLLSFLLFWPILHKGFASDDFPILSRIVYQKEFFISGFFRPLSDISLYLSWLAGGFNAVYYNAVNIFIHGSCAYILYRLCLVKNFLTVNNRTFFAWLSALLFLIYPFHNEAVAWAIGRGIVLSGFFGFLSLLVIFLDVQPVRKYLLAYTFYFIALCGYETVIVLPAIVALFLVARQNPASNTLRITIGYVLVLLANLLIRIFFSDKLWTAYGAGIFGASPKEYVFKLLKALGRAFLPPAGSSFLLGICFLAIIAGAVFISIYIVKKDKKGFSNYTCLLLAFAISFIIPAMFGISTKTFEGDRVLYFSSFFFCMLLAWLVSLLNNRVRRLVAGFAIGGYFIFFFYLSIITWRTGGKMVATVIKEVAGMPRNEGQVWLLNMPEEYNGVPVFRNGFKHALFLNHIDTAGIRVINYLSTGNGGGLKDAINPVTINGKLFVPPYTNIIGNSIQARRSYNDSTMIIVNCSSNDKIYYWNRQSFIMLKR